MRPVQLLALAFAVVVVIGAGPAVGANGTSLELKENLATDGFEDSDVQEYDYTGNKTATDGKIDSGAVSNAAEGSVAWRLIADATASPAEENTIELTTTNTFSIDANSSFNISFDVDLQTGGSEDEPCAIRFELFDGNGSTMVFKNNCRGDQDQEVVLGGTLINNANGGDGTNLNESPGYEEVVIVINRTDQTAKVFVDGSERLSTGLTGDEFSEPNNISFKFKNRARGDDFGQGNNVTALWDDIKIEAENFSDLVLDINSFMEHGTTQDYVVRNDTAEITDQATVTSSDSSVVSVDSTAETLTATSDETVNQVVTITAVVGGRSVSKDVTVANKSLNNIAILPPATWPSALFGQPGGTLGSSSTWPGAVQLQWIFVSLVVGAVASWATRTDIIGIAIAMAMLTFGWVPAIGWVSNGVLVGALLFFIWLFSTGRMEMVRT